MAKIVIELNENASEAEEIAVLRKIAAFFAARPTYLRALFTDSLMEWVEDMVKKDIDPDVYGWWIEERIAAHRVIEGLHGDVAGLMRQAESERGKWAETLKAFQVAAQKRDAEQVEEICRLRDAVEECAPTVQVDV